MTSLVGNILEMVELFTTVAMTDPLSAILLTLGAIVTGIAVLAGVGLLAGVVFNPLLRTRSGDERHPTTR